MHGAADHDGWMAWGRSGIWESRLPQVEALDMIFLWGEGRPRPRPETQLQPVSVSVVKAPAKRASFRERDSKIEEKKMKLEKMRKAPHKAATDQASATNDRAQLVTDMVKLQLQQLRSAGAFTSAPTDS